MVFTIRLFQSVTELCFPKKPTIKVNFPSLAPILAIRLPTILNNKISSLYIFPSWRCMIWKFDVPLLDTFTCESGHKTSTTQPIVPNFCLHVELGDQSIWKEFQFERMSHWWDKEYLKWVCLRWLIDGFTSFRSTKRREYDISAIGMR